MRTGELPGIDLGGVAVKYLTSAHWLGSGVRYDRLDRGRGGRSVGDELSYAASREPIAESVAADLEAILPAIAPLRRGDLGDLIHGIRSLDMAAAHQWARIDLVAAFDPDTAIHGRSGVGEIARKFTTFGIFLPLLLTWFGLHQAITAFDKMADSTSSFFAEWISGFPPEVAGPLGGLNNLSAIAVATAFVFLCLIMAGIWVDSVDRAVINQRLALRSALTDCMRLLNVRFPEFGAAAAASMGMIAAQIGSAEKAATITQGNLVRTQEEVLRSTSAAVGSLAAALAANHEEALVRLEQRTNEFQSDIERRYGAAARGLDAMLNAVQGGLEQCTEAMLQAGELVATMARHTETELSRSADADRVLTHLADSAELLRRTVERIGESGIGTRI